MADIVDILQDESAIQELAEYLTQLVESENEYIEKRLSKATAIGAAREALFVRQMEALFKRHLSGSLPPPRRRHRKKHPHTRTLHLILSDLHFGANLAIGELPVGFDHVTAARRFSKVIAETCDYKPQYRDKTRLVVHLIGDIIEGDLGHDQTGSPLAEQFLVANRYLSLGLWHLANSFESIEVKCATGNHGRNKLKHHGRSTWQKWDSFESLLYISLRENLSACKNVSFDIPKTPYCISEDYGFRVFSTHGDTHLSLGNPGKSINIGKIAGQLDSINATQRYGSMFDVFVCGHLHQPLYMPLGNSHLFINGALVPPNGFADSYGMHSICGQWLFETTPQYAVGDRRLLYLGESEDRDESLDEIIPPLEFSAYEL